MRTFDDADNNDDDDNNNNNNNNTKFIELRNAVRRLQRRWRNGKSSS